MSDQLDLLGEATEDWREVWNGMPDFDQQDLTPHKSVLVHFATLKDQQEFAKLVGQPVTELTRSLWYPKAEIGRYADKRFRAERPVNPKFPIYIVSKGRFEIRLTSTALSKMGVPHFIVVEEAEREEYESRVDSWANVLVLDPEYQRTYPTCDDLGDTKSKGPGAARNFAWDHAIQSGHKWHWVMDDNIERFYRLFNNLKTPVADGTILRAMEDFVERYENVGMAGPNYFMFASRKTVMPPLTTNTRIYSCNLIRNDTPYRWRGRYNEDTDLSLRMLKDGWCTVQFNAFLQGKVRTSTLQGGNTAEFYAKEGTRPKSEMQVKLHPDVSKLVYKFKRWHHHVDYSGFRKNKLVLRDGVTVPPGFNNYGMGLEVIEGYYDKAPIEYAEVPDLDGEEEMEEPDAVA